MNFNLDLISSVTLGAARITEEENGFNFYRFTKNEEILYKNRSEASYSRTFATSGVQFCFKTNSKNLSIKGETFAFGARKYFSIDLFVNGKMFDTLNNYSEVGLSKDYTVFEYPNVEFEKSFDLGEGEKTVKIYLPFTVKCVIKELSVDDGAVIIPVKPKHTLLAYGDSITHGYDALNPSEKYITKLAEFLDAEEINKAIGGEVFWPDLVSEKLKVNPDYITVAYGTNDWLRMQSQEEFYAACKAFFENLKNNYKEVPIYSITPIWRKDFATNDCSFGEFFKVEEIIKKVAEEIGSITVISGFNLVGHDENLFGDLSLHPNNEGFKQYFENLVKAFK